MVVLTGSWAPDRLRLLATACDARRGAPDVVQARADRRRIAASRLLHGGAERADLKAARAAGRSRRRPGSGGSQIDTINLIAC